MTPEDFFVDSDLMGVGTLNRGLIERIRLGKYVDRSDVEISGALLRLAHNELEAYAPTQPNGRTKKRYVSSCELPGHSWSESGSPLTSRSATLGRSSPIGRRTGPVAAGKRGVTS